MKFGEFLKFPEKEIKENSILGELENFKKEINKLIKENYLTKKEGELIVEYAEILSKENKTSEEIVSKRDKILGALKTLSTQGAVDYFRSKIAEHLINETKRGKTIITKNLLKDLSEITFINLKGNLQFFKDALERKTTEKEYKTLYQQIVGDLTGEKANKKVEDIYQIIRHSFATVEEFEKIKQKKEKQ